ncbi:MAG: carboxypeptidase regulatory-like domain-containing protein, partial [Akkermansiaceae bacterium]|nr:carboxypeptidase regulatory-like domain-containing protein [Armatimonadota bacterium]
MIRFAMAAIVVSVGNVAWAQAPVPAQRPDISGVVLGADKKPVAGAKVYAARWDATIYEMVLLPPVTTGADGRFVLEGKTLPDIGAATTVTAAMVYVDAPGYRFARAGVTNGKPNELTLDAGGGVVRGSVVDARGKPVAGARIQAGALSPDPTRRTLDTDIPAPFAERYKTRTDAAGEWEIRNVPASGKAYILLDDPRYVTVSREVACAPEGAAATKTGGEPFVALPASAITGTVLLPDGKPAGSVRVTAHAAGDGDGVFGSDKTNADGTFRIGKIGRGTFTLSAKPRDKSLLAPAQSGITVAAGKETALKPLALLAGTPVSGTVTDAKTGAGIA